MSLMDPMKEGSSIPSVITLKTSQVPSRFRRKRNTKSLSSTKQTIQPLMFNSCLGRPLKNSQRIVDSYSPATIKIKSSNHSTPGVLWLSSALRAKRNKKSQQHSSAELTGSWTVNGFKVIRKSLPS